MAQEPNPALVLVFRKCYWNTVSYSLSFTYTPEPFFKSQKQY